MKHLSAIIGTTLVIIAVGAAAQGLAPRPEGSTEVQALKAQVAELQGRLSALEKKVESMNVPRMHKATP